MNWTITKAAKEFGVARETLKRNLSAAGLDARAGHEYTTREIVRALHDNLRAARVRSERARADLLEVQAAKAKRDVINVGEVCAFITTTFRPVRELAVAMPGQLAARCNPADETHARAQLQAWVDLFLKQCREHKPERQAAA